MKKLNKYLAMFTAFAVMAMMCAITSFAASYAEGVGPIALSKTFTMPAGTTTPDVDFTFTFTQDTTNGNATAAAVGPLTISFDGEEGTTSGDTKTVTKTWLDVFKNTSFTAPGLYIYDVTETAGGEDGTEGKYSWAYDNSEASYKVYVAVDNTGTITSTTIVQTKTDDGDDIDEDEQEKAEGTYEGEEEDEDSDGIVEDEVAYSDFNFNNNYEKTVTNDPTGTTDDADGEDDGDSLYIEKLVSAPDGYVDDNQDFTFNITVTFPAKSTTEAYTATVVDAAGDEVSPAQSLTFTRADEDTLAQEFTLKNGQRLVFTSIDIGATWTVTETANSDYNTAYSNTANEEALRVTDSATNGTQVTNTYNKDTTTPTGILISNLPYIALALVAIGGLVAYVVIRRRDEDNA